MLCVNRFAEDQKMPAETRDIIGRLNQKPKQIQKRASLTFAVPAGFREPARGKAFACNAAFPKTAE